MIRKKEDVGSRSCGCGKSDLKKYLYKEHEVGLSVDDSLIYMTGPLEEYASYDFITKIRTILHARDAGIVKPGGISKDSSINVIINSPGGCMYEMFSVIDYMAELKKTEDVLVNVTCRGYAMSAAAMILACATGHRSTTKHSTIMLHEGSAFSLGKNSDIQASAKHSSHMEIMANDLLEEKTKKGSIWWKDNTRTDLFLSAEEALQLGVIDEII
tara:strand:- start:26292 stop:26933 length:642 start_codon:yes stop_codon:yes gene_type:complete